MRIIAGSLRGRKFLPPASDTTRPITDRVKQSLFDILSPRINGAFVYDCFAGTGSMGLECLSRGATHATFFEADRSAVTLLKQNIQTLNLAAASTVIAGDLFAWFARISPPMPKASLIFLDPPYRMVRENADKLRSFAERLSNHLVVDGIVIFRHDQNDQLELPLLNKFDQRDYNGMSIEFLTQQ